MRQIRPFLRHQRTRNPRHLLRATITPVLAMCLLASLGACTSIGPETIPRDRANYIDGVSASWKAQTLLNIVKLRYADTPVFLEVGQIVSGYTLESRLSAESGISDVDDSLLLGAEGKFVDRPTITYSPLTGSGFVRKLLAPIPPSAVLSLIQSGWPADLVLRTTVQTINGRSNQSGMEPKMRPADREFLQVVELLRSIQQSGAFGMRFEKVGEGLDTTVLFFYHEELDPDAAATIDALQETLRLEQSRSRYRVAYGAVPEGSDEIAILTRSVIQILIELASYIEVPQEHIEDNLTQKTSALESDQEAGVTPLVRIHSAAERPQDSFVEVNYDDQWYWIDKGDFASKRVFTFLMLLLMLSETGDTEKPVLTIPTG